MTNQSNSTQDTEGDRPQMTEDERCKVYWALLRGVAKECQDRLCARDTQHAWGPTIATDHWPDLPMRPMSNAQAADIKIARSYRRECANCGKVEQQ